MYSIRWGLQLRFGSKVSFQHEAFPWTSLRIHLLRCMVIGYPGTWNTSQKLGYNLQLDHSLHLQKIYPFLFEDTYVLLAQLNLSVSR